MTANWKPNSLLLGLDIGWTTQVRQALGNISVYDLPDAMLQTQLYGGEIEAWLARELPDYVSYQPGSMYFVHLWSAMIQYGAFLVARSNPELIVPMTEAGSEVKVTRQQIDWGKRGDQHEQFALGFLRMIPTYTGAVSHQQVGYSGPQRYQSNNPDAPKTTFGGG